MKERQMNLINHTFIFRNFNSAVIMESLVLCKYLFDNIEHSLIIFILYRIKYFQRSNYFNLLIKKLSFKRHLNQVLVLELWSWTQKDLFKSKNKLVLAFILIYRVT